MKLWVSCLDYLVNGSGWAIEKKFPYRAYLLCEVPDEAVSAELIEKHREIHEIITLSSCEYFLYERKPSFIERLFAAFKT